MTEQERVILIIAVSVLAYIAYYTIEEVLYNVMRDSKKKEKKTPDGPVWKEAKRALKRLGIKGEEANELLKKISFKLPHPSRVEEILEEAFKIKKF